MNQKYLISLLVFAFLTINLCAQNSWRYYKNEFIAGAGYAGCLTDLGGGTGDGGYVKDIDFQTIRYSAQLGYRLRTSDRTAFKTTFSFIHVTGSDEFSENEGRRIRNLNFRSNIMELKAQFEYYIVEEPLGKYNGPGVTYRDDKRFDYSLYLFGGIAPFYYNPQGQINGSWVDLRPLKTEGQGLEGGPSEYGKIAISFPFGVGFKYLINRQMSIGFETGVRFTTTDYLDDVSTTYYDQSELRSEVGAQSARMADRRLSDSRGNSGGIRGNPDRNDLYFAGFFTFNYKLAKDQKLKLNIFKRKKKVKF